MLRVRGLDASTPRASLGSMVWIEVAIPQRTEQRQQARPSWGRRPIVLAQLPKVGADTENGCESVIFLPPEADIAPPGIMPQIAVDRKTAGPIFQLLTDLAPYAGLVVTLALIVSAGLLYWLIVGPTQMSLPHQELAPDRSGWPAKNASTPPFPAPSPATFNPQSPSQTSDLSLGGGESPVLTQPRFQSISQAAPLNFYCMGNVFGEEPLIALPEPVPAMPDFS
ncbi:MAG: hypothetical protein MK171_01865 [Pirellulales bacterium]|nr:hypothetical protein [Pirellulales bacterium]